MAVAAAAVPPPASSGSKKTSFTGSRQFQGGQGSATRQQNASSRQQGRQDMGGDRQGQRADQRGDRHGERTDRTEIRQENRTDLRRDRSDNRWDNTWSGWGWWGASPAAWGVTALTTAAIIDAAVDDAIDDQVTCIAVPSTSYELYYPSVEPAGSEGVTFVVNTNTGTVEMTADCEQGTLDGRTPRTAAEAELLNAACVEAYGDG